MTRHSEVFLREDALPRQVVGDGIVRQLLGFDESILMARVWFEKDAIGDLHEHLHSQVSYVESGVFEVTIDGVTKILGAGDAFFIPPNTSHGARCREPGVLLDVFSPAREDFLDKGNS